MLQSNAGKPTSASLWAWCSGWSFRSGELWGELRTTLSFGQLFGNISFLKHLLVLDLRYYISLFYYWYLLCFVWLVLGFFWCFFHLGRVVFWGADKSNICILANEQNYLANISCRRYLTKWFADIIFNFITLFYFFIFFIVTMRPREITLWIKNLLLF